MAQQRVSSNYYEVRMIKPIITRVKIVEVSYELGDFTLFLLCFKQYLKQAVGGRVLVGLKKLQEYRKMSIMRGISHPSTTKRQNANPYQNQMFSVKCYCIINLSKPYLCIHLEYLQRWHGIYEKVKSFSIAISATGFLLSQHTKRLLIKSNPTI